MSRRKPRIAGIAAPMPRANIDTDQIIPMGHLVRVTREGLGEGLFSEWRYDGEGGENADFVLNREPWRRAVILVAGRNFGCGSSREHAVWALDDFGLQAVIAPSFASIFYDNAFKNGFAPVIVAAADAERLALLVEEQPDAQVTVDLEAGRVRGPDGFDCPFEMEETRRRNLIEGLDEIGSTLTRAADIAAFQAADGERRPWVYAPGAG